MTKVLFVEEREGLRAVIKDALSDVGYDVQTVAAGQDDLAAYRSVRPDLVIYNSYDGKAAHESLGFGKYRDFVIPNGVDVEKYRPDEAVRAHKEGLLVGHQLSELREHIPNVETRVAAIYRGGRSVLPRYPSSIVEVPVDDPRELADVDT